MKKRLDKPLTGWYTLYVGWLIRHRGVIQMTTLDEYVLDLNKEIDELRAKGNKSGLENVLAIKTAVLKLIAKECVAEYKELYGERVDKEYEELFGK
tara:strand:- start:76 stop:363 length:288 start_codon:yes stop_codon:yes gene_type:complete